MPRDSQKIQIFPFNSVAKYID